MEHGVGPDICLPELGDLPVLVLFSKFPIVALQQTAVNGEIMKFQPDLSHRP